MSGLQIGPLFFLKGKGGRVDLRVGEGRKKGEGRRSNLSVYISTVFVTENMFFINFPFHLILNLKSSYNNIVLY